MPQPVKSQSAKLRSPSVSMHLFTSLCLKDENHQLCEVQSKRDQQFNNNNYYYTCFNTQPCVAMTPRDSAMLTRQLFAKYLETFFHWLLLSSTQNFHIKKTRILTSIFHFMSDSKELTWVTNQHSFDPQCKYTGYTRSGSTFLAVCKTTV